MADFLTHLVARSFDRGARLQRRVPSLFEPPAGAAGPGWTEPASPREAALETRPGAPQGPPARGGDPSPVPTAPVREASTRPGSASPARAEVRLQPILIEAERTGDPVVGPSPAAWARRGEPVPAASGAGATAGDEVRGNAPHASERAVADRRPAPERVILRETRIDHTVAAPPGAARATQASGDAPRSVPRGADAPRSGNRRRHAGDAAPPAPTISVTIGRVEVRASRAADAPARARRDAAPRLNLDEYLRRRSGRSDE